MNRNLGIGFILICFLSVVGWVKGSDCTISGKVLDNRDTVVSDVSLQLMRGDIAAGKAVLTDRKGTFQISAIVPGDYKFVVTKFRFKRIVESVSISSGDNLIFNFTLEPAENGSLSGSITDLDGNPLSGISVQVIHKPENFEKTRISDFGGDYFIEDLPPGKYDIILENADYLTISETINIEAGEVFEFSAEMENY